MVDYDFTERDDGCHKSGGPQLDQHARTICISDSVLQVFIPNGTAPYALPLMSLGGTEFSCELDSDHSASQTMYHAIELTSQIKKFSTPY